MWDLCQLIEENNRAAVKYMMEGYKSSVLDMPKPKMTLSVLAAKLQVSPPLLNELINLCTNTDTIEEFLGLIRAFLPEHEEEILAERRMQRVYRFAYLFGERYFPLPPFIHEVTLGEFVRALPVTLMGMSHSVYHEPGDLRPGYTLLLSLVVYPYYGDERDTDDLGDTVDPEDIKIPLLDLVGKMVGTELAQSIPKKGWMPGPLHKLTDGTIYEGMGSFADWVCGSTNCIIMDSNYADCDYMEGYGEPVFKWTDRNVKALAEEWPKVVKIRQAIDHIVDWVEVDMVNNFGQLLKYLLAQKTETEAETPPEYNWEDHICPLDQITEDDGYDDDND